MTTLKELSKIVGVHPSVISRVINEDPTLKIKDSTRQKIKDTVKKMKYQPNQMARNLKLNRTNMLGMVIPDIANPVYSEIIKGAESEADKQGFSLLIYSEHNKKKNDFLKLINDNHVDGLLIASHNLDKSAFKELEDSNKPFIFVNGKYSNSKNYVVLDDKEAGRIATEHLIEFNHTSILHISGPIYADSAIQRLQGFREALHNKNYNFTSNSVIESQYTIESGYEAMIKIIHSKKMPTAIFAANILIALGALKALKEHNINVPDDVSVIGLHDTYFTSILSPSLTTIKLPLFELGKKSVENIINMIIKNQDTQPGQIIQGAKLIQRESTAKLDNE
nr:LacI family DNA-binding transcriptional regulator [Mammaliicoccus sp. Marseille-Q6498]